MALCALVAAIGQLGGAPKRVIRVDFLTHGRLDRGAPQRRGHPPVALYNVRGLNDTSLLGITAVWVHLAVLSELFSSDTALNDRDFYIVFLLFNNWLHLGTEKKTGYTITGFSSFP